MISSDGFIICMNMWTFLFAADNFVARVALFHHANVYKSTWFWLEQDLS